jgi:two-component system, chemotaxis family, response regulator Rcp1
MTVCEHRSVADYCLANCRTLAFVCHRMQSAKLTLAPELDLERIDGLKERAHMSSSIKPLPNEVLLVEDSPGDVRLTREAFRDANPAVRLHVAVDGVEAMAFLRREGAHAIAPRPELILLDLNMPRMDGREVLALLKADEGLRKIPTVVLTTSDLEEDVVRSYALQASCYVCKPVELDAFEELVRSVSKFWLTTVRLPQAHRSS